MLNFFKSLFKVVVKTVPSDSPAGVADKVDALKAIRTAGLVGIAASLSYLVTHLSSVDLGEYATTLVPVVAFVLDYLYRLVKDNTPKE